MIWGYKRRALAKEARELAPGLMVEVAASGGQFPKIDFSKQCLLPLCPLIDQYSNSRIPFRKKIGEHILDFMISFQESLKEAAEIDHKFSNILIKENGHIELNPIWSYYFGLFLLEKMRPMTSSRLEKVAFKVFSGNTRSLIEMGCLRPIFASAESTKIPLSI